MSLSDHISTNAHYVTYTSAAGTMIAGGLHVPEIAVMVSSLAAVCGAVIQVLSYLERRPGRPKGDTETKDNGETH